MFKKETEDLSGWGNYPKEKSTLFFPENKEQTQQVLHHYFRHYIARGNGKSYGDAALNYHNGILVHQKLHHFLSFDEKEAILTCQVHVTLQDIIETFVPKGYFLSVTPGIKSITLGGAIANDVHGKNHYLEQSFSQTVISFTLLLASGEIITCSREENKDIFWATFGSVGLTGIVLTVSLKLKKIETSYLSVTYQKTANLFETLKHFETSLQNEYAVAWIDCLSKGKHLGRSILMTANHTLKTECPKKDPLTLSSKKQKNIPFMFPSFVLNGLSIRAYNELYYRVNSFKKTTLTHYEEFFYPLDSLSNWNRMYGKKGFLQYQCVLPLEHSEQGLKEILEKLSQSSKLPFLAVLKRLGKESISPFSFPMEGYCLALDLPIKNDDIFPFLDELDQLVLRYKGRLYLAKDSRMKPDMFHASYGQKMDYFKQVKKQVDPHCLFSSSLSRRLQIDDEIFHKEGKL